MAESKLDLAIHDHLIQSSLLFARVFKPVFGQSIVTTLGATVVVSLHGDLDVGTAIRGTIAKTIWSDHNELSANRASGSADLYIVSMEIRTWQKCNLQSSSSLRLG